MFKLVEEDRQRSGAGRTNGMKTPDKKPDENFAITRRALLGALPAVPAIPLLTSGSARGEAREEAATKNQPVYKPTPHIEAFYERSRF